MEANIHLICARVVLLRVREDPPREISTVFPNTSTHEYQRHSQHRFPCDLGGIEEEAESKLRVMDTRDEETLEFNPFTTSQMRARAAVLGSSQTILWYSSV
jgi:hypothetical protein